MEKRREIANIPYDYDRLSLREVKDKIDEASKIWEELKEKGEATREQELLDFHDTEIGNNIIKEKAMRKRIIKRVKKNQKRNHQFQYLT